MSRSLPEQICEAGRLMFAKRLTDLAGGNISTRDDEHLYMSPRFAGQRFHWDLTPEDLVVGDWRSDEITTNPKFSREGWSHLYIYRRFPNVRAVIHAHAFHIMPFAAACKPMPAILEGTQKFGTVPVCQQAKAHTKDLADSLIPAFLGQEARMHTQAAAVLMPYHGIILAGEDFDKTLDALERLDGQAYCLTVARLLE